MHNGKELLMPPTLSYAPAPRPDSVNRIFVFASIAGGLSFFNDITIMCACGFHSWHALPGNLAATALALWAFTFYTRWWFVRSFAAAMVVLCVFNLFFNMHNILWSGHDALLRYQAFPVFIRRPCFKCFSKCVI